MAKARERAAEEAHSAAEAEKSAWKEGETKRVEDKVRLGPSGTLLCRAARYTP